MDRSNNIIYDTTGQTATNVDATISSELSKRIVSHSGCEKKVSNDTAAAISEVIRMFVIEARARASIEAECDLEGGVDDENDGNGVPSNMVSIRGDHITKVAAEMLMDFS